MKLRNKKIFLIALMIILLCFCTVSIIHSYQQTDLMQVENVQVNFNEEEMIISWNEVNSAEEYFIQIEYPSGKVLNYTTSTVQLNLNYDQIPEKGCSIKVQAIKKSEGVEVYGPFSETIFLN